MSENLFLTASRSKFRFNSASGPITAEDLWDLPLSGGRSNLDDIAKALNKQLKESNEESFVKPVIAKTNELQTKFDLVLYVIKVKLEERDAAKAKADKAQTKQQMMAIIEQKKNEALSSKSIEELQSMVNAL